MFLSHHQTAEENHDINKIKSLKNVAKLKYLGTLVINQNYIHEKLRAD
jgi:hypothetical protein